MYIENNNSINIFINEVCTHIKLKEVHEQIRLELENHIEEEVEEYLENGFNKEDAIKKAIANMGNSETIGKQLNKAHKGTPDWSLVALSVFFSFIGILLMYLLQNKVGLKYAYGNVFYKTLTYFVMGATLMFLFYVVDYRKLEKYSKYMFIAIILFTIFIQLNYNNVNRIAYPMGINFTESILFLLIISLSGIFSSCKVGKRWWRLYTLILLIVPVFFLLTIPNLSTAIMYFTAFLVLLQTSKFKLKLKYIIAGISIIIIPCIFYAINSPYIMARIFSFLIPFKNPQGMGYIYVRSYELMNAAGPFGNGFVLPPKAMPEIHTDFIFVYIIYAFGWIVASMLTILILFFIVRLFKSANKIKDNYGKLLIKGLSTIFAMKFLWNILMILGLAPIAGISMPFISYGGSSLLLSMASIGIILSVYKRRTIENVLLGEKSIDA